MIAHEDGLLHGWQSVPGGVKPTFLAQHGHEVINPKLPDENFNEAVRIAQAEFDKHQPDVVVGSSRGGAVAMNINSGEAKPILLCPTWKKWGIAKTVKAGAVILHSRADDVVLFCDSEELVKNNGLPTSALIEVGTDHRLADPEPLRAMLEACEDFDFKNKEERTTKVDLGRLLHAISDYDDDKLLERVRAMASQLSHNTMSRLSVLPSYISTLQGILDRTEEKAVLQESTLDELWNTLQRFRDSVVKDLENARRDFESVRQQLTEKGRVEEANEAQHGVQRIIAMQDAGRVFTDELPKLDDLYGTLLSSLVFKR